MLRFLILISSFLTTALFAEGRGIVMAVADRYMHMAVPSIALIRLHHKSDMPIEVWHAGDELSETSKQILQLFKNVKVQDIAEKYNRAPEFFQGFQIKGFLLDAAAFDEILLMDADTFLYMSPEELFSISGYVETGAFFFRDKNRSWRKNQKDFRYEERVRFLRSLIAEPSAFLPQDWKFYWSEDHLDYQKHRPDNHMESGVVLVDRRKHQGGVDRVLRLNEDHKAVYRVVHGDKETYWMGFEAAKEPYKVNDMAVFSLQPTFFRFTFDPIFKKFRTSSKLVHLVDDQLCFQQKIPVPVSKGAFFLLRDSEVKFSRKLSEGERELVGVVRKFYEVFSNLDQLISNDPKRVNYGSR